MTVGVPHLWCEGVVRVVEVHLRVTCLRGGTFRLLALPALLGWWLLLRIGERGESLWGSGTGRAVWELSSLTMLMVSV